MIKVLLITLAAYLVIRCSFWRLPKVEVNIIIAIVLLGNLLAIGRSVELWPFSQYPMFANVQSERMVRYRLIGITDEPEPREIPLIDEYAHPFPEVSLVFAFNRFGRDADRQRLQAAAEDCLRRYEQRRTAGLHNGPPLRGVRLYQATWQLEAWAEDRETTLQRQLLLEVVPAATQEAAP